MTIIHVDRPSQNEFTENPQLIDGEVKYWEVKGIKIKTRKLSEWIKEQEIKVASDPKYKDVIGLYLYDVYYHPGFNQAVGKGYLLNFNILERDALNKKYESKA